MPKVLHGVPFSLETPSPPPPPPSSLERIIYNPTNFAYKSFRSSPSSFYIHIYFFFRFFRSAALRWKVLYVARRWRFLIPLLNCLKMLEKNSAEHGTFATRDWQTDK